MNPPKHTAPSAAAATASTTEASGGLYQRLTLRALAQMPRGRLHLELPDGTVHRFGGRETAQWHATTLAPAALAMAH